MSYSVSYVDMARRELIAKYGERGADAVLVLDYVEDEGDVTNVRVSARLPPSASEVFVTIAVDT